MGCPPVRGDNPRALPSGLSYVQVDKHGITILYHIHREIVRAKVGKGGIKQGNQLSLPHQDCNKTSKDTKHCITKQGPNTEPQLIM